MPRYMYLLPAAFAAIAATACSVNPVTGEQQFLVISPKQAEAMGEKNYLPYQQQQGARYSVDPELNLYVNKVGQALARVSDSPELPYEFVVLNNDTPNAWALPGGKIAINRGLLILLEDEAQLAAVLSHEVVHAAARHGAAQMSQAVLLGLGVQATSMATKDTEYGGLATIGAGFGTQYWSARYGRDQELESDSYGIDYMVKAGYDPQAAVELQQKFVALSKQRGSSNWLQDLFASHPPSQERVEKNRTKAAKLPKGKRNLQQYEAAIAQLRKDEHAYDYHLAALKAGSSDKVDEARQNIRLALKQQPEEALFHITDAQLSLMEGKQNDAKRSFEKARRLNPDYYKSHLGLGMISKRQGKNSEAKKHLLNSMKLLPSQAGAFHLGEIERNQGNKEAAVRYFSMAAGQGGELGKQAQEQLSELQPAPESATDTQQQR